jgi:hypothetical protein
MRNFRTEICAALLLAATSFVALAQSPSGGLWLLKMKNPGCSAVKREAEEDWGR